MEKTIRKDVQKANRSLKHVERWRQYQSSPINFWLTSIGGHIPILSNVLTAIYTLGTLATDSIEHHNSWVLLAQPKVTKRSRRSHTVM